MNITINLAPYQRQYLERERPMNVSYKPRTSTETVEKCRERIWLSVAVSVSVGHTTKSIQAYQYNPCPCPCPYPGRAESAYAPRTPTFARVFAAYICVGASRVKKVLPLPQRVAWCCCCCCCCWAQFVLAWGWGRVATNGNGWVWGGAKRMKRDQERQREEEKWLHTWTSLRRQWKY